MSKKRRNGEERIKEVRCEDKKKKKCYKKEIEENEEKDEVEWENSILLCFDQKTENKKTL